MNQQVSSSPGERQAMGEFTAVQFEGGPLDGKVRAAWRSQWPKRALVRWIEGGFSFLDAAFHDSWLPGYESYELSTAPTNGSGLAIYRWVDPEPVLDRASRLIADATRDVLGPDADLLPMQQMLCREFLDVEARIAMLGRGGGKSTVRKVVCRALELADQEEQA